MRYRWSSMAMKYAHIRAPYGVPTGSTASNLLCGMCDVSSKGRWQEANHESAIPIHLVICPKCLTKQDQLQS